jgi:hypothetical protein
MTILKRIAIALYIAGLLVAASIGIDRAARDMLLIPMALPAALVLMLATRVLRPQAELVCWAIFTVWLGSTYVGPDAPLEGVLFTVYVGLALFGVFRSPYALAVAWLFHPVWDFVPRTLPELFRDLPVACILFDIPIGLYLLWGARSKRWFVFAFKPWPGGRNNEATALANPQEKQL